MSNTYPLKLNGDADQNELQAQLDSLALELKDVQQKTDTFENTLRSYLENMIIEVQELTVLYKQQKAAKKEKRLKQKKKGKNYTAPDGLKKVRTTKNVITDQQDQQDQQEKKRLYREAMLLVHPDKFSMQTDKLELATTVTTKLIDIYTTGDLETLKAYHAHIFENHEFLLDGVVLPQKNDMRDNSYLLLEIDKMKQKVEKAKSKHTYKVLMEYEDPMIFLEELREYYADRLLKLKKRTRRD